MLQPDEPVEAYRFCLWRLAIAADQQGKGYGRFALEKIAQRAAGVA